MKKTLVLILVLSAVICLPSCSNNKTNDGEATTEQEIMSEEVYENTTQEDVSFAVKPVDFSMPYTFEESFNFIKLPEFDNSEKAEDSSEIFYKGETPVMKKVYDSLNRVTEVTVYDEDGKTVKTAVKYKYDNMKGFSYENYKDGVCTDKYYITYDMEAEYANAACKMVTDSQTGGSTMEMYELNKDGEVIKYIDNASFADMILNSVIGALGE